MIVNVFERTEKKYRVEKNIVKDLIYSMSDNVMPDKFGKYTICNLYFDTDDYSIIRKSTEKPVFKEKLRLRSYGVPSLESDVFFEIKRKYKGIVSKRRISLPLWEAQRYLRQGVSPSQDSQIFREIDYMMKFYNPGPKLFLAYDRMAFWGVHNKDLRLTFDYNIRSRQDDLSLEQGDNGDLLLDKNVCIMEIKTNSAIPLWLTEILSKNEIYPTSFSKYGTVYQQKIWSDYYV
ncbi:MAG: VTC domain protein [Firmicutes bacterium ADurb.Bin300]|nr:MAG: VTC domain protein [Firmicutes bacterium ADurb.Bin300]